MSLPGGFANHRKENVVLLSLSSEDATYRDSGTFRINMGNSTETEHAAGLQVIGSTLTHKFPNIHEYNNIISDGTTTYTLPIGFYDAGAFVAAFNALNVAGGAGITAAVVNNRVELTNNIQPPPPPLINLQGTSELFSMLGYTQDQMLPSGNPALPYQLPLPAGGTSIPSEEFNFSGDKKIFIECDELAHGNSIDGSDGSVHDHLVVIPIAETQYGATVHYTPADANAFMIQFPNAKSINNTLTFRIKDSRHRLRAYPENCHVYLDMKLHYFHPH